MSRFTVFKIFQSLRSPLKDHHEHYSHGGIHTKVCADSIYHTTPKRPHEGPIPGEHRKLGHPSDPFRRMRFIFHHGFQPIEPDDAESQPEHFSDGKPPDGSA